MKFKIEQAELDSMLQDIRRVPPHRTTMAVYKHVLIEARNGALNLTVMNNYMQVRRATREVEVEEAGSLTTPFNRLAALVNSLGDGALTLFEDNHKLRLRSKRSRSTFDTLPADSFPELQYIDDENAVEIEPLQFYDAMSRVTPAVSTDESATPVLCGIFLRFDGNLVTMATTDKLRMARAVAPAPGCEVRDLVLPDTSARQVLRLGREKLYVSRPRNGLGVAFSDGDSVVVSNLMDGNYPDHVIDRVFSMPVEHRAVIDREMFKTVMGRALIFAKEVNDLVYVSCVDDTMTVIGDIGGTGAGEKSESTFDIEHDGVFEFLINGQYVLDMLRTIHTERLVMEGLESERPVIFTEEDGHDAYHHAIMPMYIPKDQQGKLIFPKH